MPHLLSSNFLFHAASVPWAGRRVNAPSTGDTDTWIYAEATGVLRRGRRALGQQILVTVLGVYGKPKLVKINGEEVLLETLKKLLTAVLGNKKYRIISCYKDKDGRKELRLSVYPGHHRGKTRKCFIRGTRGLSDVPDGFDFSFETVDDPITRKKVQVARTEPASATEKNGNEPPPPRLSPPSRRLR